MAIFGATHTKLSRGTNDLRGGSRLVMTGLNVQAGGGVGFRLVFVFATIGAENGRTIGSTLAGGAVDARHGSIGGGVPAGCTVDARRVAWQRLVLSLETMSTQCIATAVVYFSGHAWQAKRFSFLLL